MKKIELKSICHKELLIIKKMTEEITKIPIKNKPKE